MATDKKAATPAAKSQAVSLDITRSDETLDLAKDLAKFIKDNKLSTQVQGKEFVNVEGWQYAGSRLGIVPIVEHVINVSSEAEIKYQAKVTLFDLRHQSTVGAGFAICSNKESGKKFYQEFAIASMAQTRAIGKAYRNILAWIIRAAGYEPTPAEEMSEVGTGAEVLHGQPAGNAGGGSAPTSEPPAMHAASSSAAPAASTGSGLKGEANDLLILLNYLDKELGAGDAKRDADRTMLTGAGLPKGRISDLLAEYKAIINKEAPYATASQKEEIIRLLNHPLITRQEKTKMLLNINRLSEKRAVEAIAKLRQAIQDREGSTAVAA